MTVEPGGKTIATNYGWRDPQDGISQIDTFALIAGTDPDAVFTVENLAFAAVGDTTAPEPDPSTFANRTSPRWWQ